MDTLTRMRAFIDVVEAEGFSAAARKIGRSKALLSKYVRELEDELGALLLNRTTRQFSLTEAGHTYYKRASEIVREIDSLADAVRESSGDVRGRIKLSAPRTFADAPIGQSLIDFAVAHPDIVLDIQLDDRFVDLVEEGFDLAIRITRLENSSLIARRLLPLRHQVCALAGAHRRSTARRRGRRIWPACPASSTPMAAGCRTGRSSRRTARRFSVAVNWTDRGQQPDGGARGRGVGAGLRQCCPTSSPRPTSRPAGWCRSWTSWMPKGGGIFAVYPHRRYLPAKVRVLVDFLVQWFKDKG